MDKVIGSENVFEDLGFDEAEAALLKQKSDAALALRKAVERHAISQTKAAEMTGMSRATLNRVLKGDLAKITLDRLFKASYKLGVKQSVTYRQQPRKRAATG
jgi:predicted XRE-type DNA-binding protein